jgi:very-short-patch-repair endonuclease
MYPHRKFVPYDQQLVTKARENRKHPTPAEKKMWFEVLGRKSFQDLKFTRQKPLDHYIVDFYCSKLLLVVEIDGDSHTEQIGYDQKRTKRLGQYGIHVIRYTNNDVMQNLEGVYEDLWKMVEALRNEVPP